MDGFIIGTIIKAMLGLANNIWFGWFRNLFWEESFSFYAEKIGTQPRLVLLEFFQLLADGIKLFTKGGFYPPKCLIKLYISG